MKTYKDIIAVDIGNSRIKIKDESGFYAFKYNGPWQNSVQKILSGSKAGNLVYSSVNSSVLKDLLKIADKEINVFDVRNILNKIDLVDFSQVAGIGTDRILSMAGALSLTAPPLVTIDCGTAVTINFLDADRVCIGGTIFAGAYTQLKGLASYADQLKNIHYNSTLPVAAKGTKGAICSGITASIVGGIKEVIKNSSAAIAKGRPLKIFITGGYGASILQYLDIENSSLQYYKDLVLKGIFHSFEVYSKSET